MKKDKKNLSYYAVILVVIVSMVFFLSAPVSAQYGYGMFPTTIDSFSLGQVNAYTATDPFSSGQVYSCTATDPFSPTARSSKDSGSLSGNNTNLNYPAGLRSAEWWYNQAMERYNDKFMGMYNNMPLEEPNYFTDLIVFYPIVFPPPLPEINFDNRNNIISRRVQVQNPYSFSYQFQYPSSNWSSYSSSFVSLAY